MSDSNDWSKPMSHLNAEGKECEIESPHFVPPMGDRFKDEQGDE